MTLLVSVVMLNTLKWWCMSSVVFRYNVLHEV